MDEKTLTTWDFVIDVAKRVHNGEGIQSSDSWDVLDTVLEDTALFKSLLEAHVDNKENPHEITMVQLGMDNVENKSSEMIRTEITKDNVTTALGYTPYTPTEVDNKISALESSLDWKETVATYDELLTTYANAEKGWTVNVGDESGMTTYRYNETEWVDIGVTAIPKATENNDGLMSKEDKAKLEELSSGGGSGEVTGVKGDNETTYRKGNVNITAENIGAVATSKVLDTAELISANTASGNVAGALGVKQIKNALNDSINTLNTNLQTTVWGNGNADNFERMKGLVENKKIPTDKPFMMKETSYGHSTLIGHCYNNYTYGGFLVITIGEVYYAKVYNGTLASLTKIPLSASDLGLGNIMTGFSNRTTGLWGAGGTELDNLNSGITVLSASPKSEYADCDSWYYKTFYENGDNDKNYGIQIAIPRMKYTTIFFRQKNNGSWGDWIEK